jgi:uncharacterized membrane protein
LSTVTTVASPSHSASQPSWAQRIDAWVHGVVAHWLLAINVLLGIFVGLPWLAPVLMYVGQEGPARFIYGLYSLLCHQLPERSWFLFGPRFTPTLAEIDRASGAGANFFALRHFIGNPEMGWKLAWSDRMVSFYGGWFLFGVIYALVRQARPGWRGLRWQTALPLLLPMFLDGVTHAISDLWGVGQGFRDSNAWLAAMTGYRLSATFNIGDAWGSFNSLARLITGLLAAAGLILWLFPWLNRLFKEVASEAELNPSSR